MISTEKRRGRIWWWHWVVIHEGHCLKNPQIEPVDVIPIPTPDMLIGFYTEPMADQFVRFWETATDSERQARLAECRRISDGPLSEWEDGGAKIYVREFEHPEPFTGETIWERPLRGRGEYIRARKQLKEIQARAEAGKPLTNDDVLLLEDLPRMIDRWKRQHSTTAAGATGRT